MLSSTCRIGLANGILFSRKRKHSCGVESCSSDTRNVTPVSYTHLVAEKLGRMSGILVAPGFGNRGIEGKIVAVRYARENKIPFLGICL